MRLIHRELDCAAVPVQRLEARRLGDIPATASIESRARVTHRADQGRTAIESDVSGAEDVGNQIPGERNVSCLEAGIGGVLDV